MRIYLHEGEHHHHHGDEAPHDHHHEHEHVPHSGTEQEALLRYFIEHNLHHKEELQELAAELPEAAAKSVLEAAELTDAVNNLLREAHNVLV
ncbi:MAG: hypothetical protein LBN97_03295 [Oscillospiraceae bacterium]|jgi:phytoene/squalene synthetase|nr:hypothetical protein [Oscillospiraceae bacterium]